MSVPSTETYTVEITKTEYSLVVSANASWFLVGSNVPHSIEYVRTTDDETQPDVAVKGRILDAKEFLSRDLIVTGAIWAKVASQFDNSVVTLFVDADQMPDPEESEE